MNRRKVLNIQELRRRKETGTMTIPEVRVWDLDPFLMLIIWL